MAESRTILVTGVAGYWGSRVTSKLSGSTNHSVLGLDVESPEKIPDLDFVPADIRNPLLADLLKAEKVDTVCHLAFVDSTRPSEAAFNANVMGTINLLKACAQAGVGKVVLKSSTAVYGAHPSNSSFLTEEAALRGSRHYGYTRDMIEIETFCNGFRHEEETVALTILRFPSIVGLSVDTPMTRFLSEAWTPSLLGFDPMMQLVHEKDVVDALVHAVLSEVSGTYNVAAADALPLNKIRSIANKPPISLFHPFAYWGVRLLGGTGLGFSHYVPIELDYIRYPWVADLTKMREELDFEPIHTAEETVREFADRKTGHGKSQSEDPDYGEERLHDIMEQRRRQRERQAATASNMEEGVDHE